MPTATLKKIINYRTIIPVPRSASSLYYGRTPDQRQTAYWTCGGGGGGGGYHELHACYSLHGLP